MILVALKKFCGLPPEEYPVCYMEVTAHVVVLKISGNQKKLI